MSSTENVRNMYNISQPLLCLWTRTFARVFFSLKLNIRPAVRKLSRLNVDKFFDVLSLKITLSSFDFFMLTKSVAACRNECVYTCFHIEVAWECYLKFWISVKRSYKKKNCQIKRFFLILFVQGACFPQSASKCVDWIPKVTTCL